MRWLTITNMHSHNHGKDCPDFLVIMRFETTLFCFREVLIICVCSYFVLMGVLTLYTTFIEKGIFAVATQDDGTTRRTWQASSDMKKYDDKYILTLSVKDSKGIREATITKSVANFIDTNGVVLEDVITNELNRIYNSISVEKKDK